MARYALNSHVCVSVCTHLNCAGNWSLSTRPNTTGAPPAPAGATALTMPIAQRWLSGDSSRIWAQTMSPAAYGGRPPATPALAAADDGNSAEDREA